MAHSDWIPSREQDLVDLSAKWTAGLADPASQTAFGWDAAECAATAQKSQGFGDKAVPLVNAVKLDLHPLPDIAPQGGTGLEPGFGVDAFGKMGLRALVLPGKANAQVEDRGFDLVAVCGQIVDKLAGCGKAFLNDLWVGLNVVALRFASNAIDVQFRLEQGLEVVGLLSSGQKA